MSSNTLDVSVTTPAHLTWIINQLTELRYDGWKLSVKDDAPPLPVQPGTTLDPCRVSQFVCQRIIAASPALQNRAQLLDKVFQSKAAKNLIADTFWIMFLEFFALTDGVARVMAYRHIVGGLMDELHQNLDDTEMNSALTDPKHIQILENALRAGVQSGNALTHGFLSSCGFVTMDVSGVQSSGSGVNSTRHTTAKNVSQVPMPHHLTPRILEDVEGFDWDLHYQHQQEQLRSSSTSPEIISRTSSRASTSTAKKSRASSSRASSTTTSKQNHQKNHHQHHPLSSDDEDEEAMRKRVMRHRSKSVAEDSPEIALQMLKFKQKATNETTNTLIGKLKNIPPGRGSSFNSRPSTTNQNQKRKPSKTGLFDNNDDDDMNDNNDGKSSAAVSTARPMTTTASPTSVCSRKSPRKKVRTQSRASSLFLGENYQPGVTAGTILNLVLTIGKTPSSSSSSAASSASPLGSGGGVFGMTRAVLEELVRAKMQENQYKPYSGRTEATAALRLLRDAGLLEKIQTRKLLLDKFISAVDAESISKKRGVVLAAMEAVAEEQNKIFSRISVNFVALMKMMAPRGHASSFVVPRDMVLPFLSDVLSQTFCALIFDCMPYFRAELKLETRKAVKRHLSFWFDGVDKDEVSHWGYHFAKPHLMIRNGAENTTLRGIVVGQKEQSMSQVMNMQKQWNSANPQRELISVSPSMLKNNNNNNNKGGRNNNSNRSPTSPNNGMISPDSTSIFSSGSGGAFPMMNLMTPKKPSTARAGAKPRPGFLSNTSISSTIGKPNQTVSFSAALSPALTGGGSRRKSLSNSNNIMSASMAIAPPNSNSINAASLQQQQERGMIPFFAGVTSIPGPRNARAELIKKFNLIEDEQREERRVEAERKRLQEIEEVRQKQLKEMQELIERKKEKERQKKERVMQSSSVGFGNVMNNNRDKRSAAITTPPRLSSSRGANNSNSPIQLQLTSSSSLTSKSPTTTSFNPTELYAQIDTNFLKLPKTMMTNRSATSERVDGENVLAKSGSEFVISPSSANLTRDDSLQPIDSASMHPQQPPPTQQKKKKKNAAVKREESEMSEDQQRFEAEKKRLEEEKRQREQEINQQQEKRLSREGSGLDDTIDNNNEDKKNSSTNAPRKVGAKEIGSELYKQDQAALARKNQVRKEQIATRQYTQARTQLISDKARLEKANKLMNTHRFAPSKQPDVPWHRHGAQYRPPPSATMAMTTGNDFFAEGEFHIGDLSPVLERFCEEQQMKSAKDVRLKYPSKMEWCFFVKANNNKGGGRNSPVK